ncbi:MAG: hypothetical protein GX629_11085, partial [Phycisphaerae bacterium]|nr:hypothetical protein [Phycisphaerae bacterium]
SQENENNIRSCLKTKEWIENSEEIKMMGTATPTATDEKPLTDKSENGKTFKATFSNGVTAELAGVAYHPSKGKQWWRADGSEMNISPCDWKDDGSEIQAVEKRKEYIFVIELANLSDRSLNSKWKISPSLSTHSSSSYCFKEGSLAQGFYGSKAVVASDVTKVKISFGLAAGEWKPCVASNGKVRRTDIVRLEDKVAEITLMEAYQVENEIRIEAKDNALNYANRIIAIDKEDKIHQPSPMSRNLEQPLRLTKARFGNLKLDQIKEFQFQTRPYEWVEFKNVSLEPGFKTEVEIVNSDASKKMVGRAHPTPKKSILSFRIAAELDDSEKEKYIKQLAAEGPMVGRERKDVYQWYETSIEDYGRIVKEYQGKRYMLLSNQPEKTMLPETWGLRSVSETKDAKDNPAISFEFDDTGAKLFGEITKTNIGKPLAILIDEKVVSAPTIHSSISRRGIITGNFSQEECTRIIESLKAGMVGEIQPESADNSVINRTLFGPQYGKESMIDFETGKVSVMPTNLGEDIEKVKRWLAERGIDAAANTDKTVRGLIGYDIAVFPLSDRDWKEGFDDIESIKSATSGFPVFFMGKETLPVTYLFKTREGGIGILQILEVQNKTAPTYVRIQYKMIEQGKTPTTQKITSQPVVKAPEDSSAEQNQLSEESHDILEKVGRIDIGRASKKDVIGVFGEPGAYLWGQNELDKNKLPSHYVMNYPGGFQAFIAGGYVNELRFEEPGPFVHPSGLRVGMELEEAVAILGKPKKIVQGQANQFADGVLYKDINGQSGLGYYGRQDKGVRIFFLNDQIKALYLTGPMQAKSKSTQEASIKPSNGNSNKPDKPETKIQKAGKA